MALKKRTHLGDQEGLKLSDDSTPITEEEAKYRTEEMRRCWNDLDYFVEHYYTIIAQNGEKQIIKMFPKQRELLHKIRDNTRVICLAARQTGKSETYSMFCVYQILTQRNYKILIAGNKGEIAREILGKIKDAYELVPNWMKPNIKTWNESKIVFDNGVTIKACTVSKQTARGNTCDLTILDEFSFIHPSTQTLFYTAISPGLSARKNSRLVIVSTPNGTGDLYHKIWTDATKNPDTIWVGHRIDWWERPDRDEEWHKQQLQTLGSEEAFQQEFGNSFNVQAGDKLVTDERILKLKEIAEKSDAVKMFLPIDPNRTNSKQTYTQYFEYNQGHTYVMGVDSAEGTGRDASIIYIMDITRTDNIQLVAKFESSKTIPSEFAYCIYRLYLKYHNPKIMLECNAVGMAVIEALRNISNNKDILSNPRRSLERFNMLDIVNYNRPAGHTGIMANNSSKSISLIHLQSLIQSEHYKLILPDDALFRELPFCEKRSGNGNTTYRASKDHHDDHIMALNWALFITSRELVDKFYSVEYATDPETKQLYPVTILPLGTDIDEYNRAKRCSELSPDEAIKLAMKWSRLGDRERASYIMNTIFARETEDTYGEWGHNPYEIDQSLYSDSFKKKFFTGKYSSENRDDGYFKPPVSDPNFLYTDNIPFGWAF